MRPEAVEVVVRSNLFLACFNNNYFSSESFGNGSPALGSKGGNFVLFRKRRFVFSPVAADVFDKFVSRWTVGSGGISGREFFRCVIAHLTGWGSRTVPDSVLVIDARGKTAKSILYFRETAGKNTDEFFANSDIGEFWVGSRPGLKQVQALLGINTKSLKKLDEDLKAIDKSVIVDLDTGINKQ